MAGRGLRSGGRLRETRLATAGYGGSVGVFRGCSRAREAVR